MQCVLCFIQWKKNWWIERSALRADARLDVQEGVLAYASKQANILTQMGMCFAAEWYPILVRGGLSAEWPEEYLTGQQRDLIEERAFEQEIQDDEVILFDDDLFD